MKLPLVVALFLLSLTPAPTFAQTAPHRIAVIDVNQILEESTAGKAIAARLKAAQAPRLEKLTKLDTEIRKLENDYGIHQLAWSESQTDAQLRLIKDKKADLQRLTQDADRELGEMRDREIQSLEAKIEPIIEAVAKDKNLDAVFNKYQSGLIYASDRLDITSDVITRFNAAK